MTDLDVIEPAGARISFRGHPIEITPLKVGELPRFARAIKPLGAIIEAIASGRAALDLATVLELIAEHGDAVVQAVAIGARINEDDIRDATPDQLVELAVAVLRINADFFKGRLTPAILAAVKAATTHPPGAGPTP